MKEPSATGSYGWMISLKCKMANYRIKDAKHWLSEMTENVLKNKCSDERLPANTGKKPTRLRSIIVLHTLLVKQMNMRAELLNDVR